MYDYNAATKVAYDPQGFCLPPGGPRMFGTPYPSQLIQDRDRKRIIVIFEGGAHVWREIYMDGRQLPDRESVNPTYFGYSVGHWEGDTLVVETQASTKRRGSTSTARCTPISSRRRSASPGRTATRCTTRR